MLVNLFRKIFRRRCKLSVERFDSVSYESAWKLIKKEGNIMVEVESGGVSKGVKTIGTWILRVIQFFPLVEGWISYLLGSIVASLFIPLAQISLLWYPVDMLFKAIWVGCEVLKQKIWGRDSTWSASSRRWENQFPRF